MSDERDLTVQKKERCKSAKRALSTMMVWAMLCTMVFGTAVPVKAASYELLNPISGSVQGTGYSESAGHYGIDLYPYNYGDPVYAVASGTIMYSCPRNHTKVYQSGDDCCTVKIILDEPITYNGMTYVCAFYTHMSSLVYDIYCGYKPDCVSEYNAGLRQGALPSESVHVEAGDLIGYVGKGNGATHLHLSFEASEADGYTMMPNSEYYDVFGWEYNDTVTAKETNTSSNNTPSQDEVTNNNYPYPSLLYYSDLDSSFNQLARNKISSAYQDYILKAIKYHIESSDGDYRVAKNLLQKYDTVDGNVIFFFDGCSVNLDGSTPTFSGYLKDGKRYNTSAVCIAVRANAQGRPYVAFASANASTMADNVRKASLNSGTPVPITIDGIYNISAVNHQSKYAAMNINTLTNSAVRCSTDGVSYIDKGNGINIHSKGYSNAYLTDSTYSSTGCFNVGRTVGDAEYNEFILQATGMSNAYNSKFSSSPTSFGISNGSMVGIVIVDRSNYISQLETIYGDDSVSGGWSKQKIASEITKNSVQWHEDIEGTLPSTPSHTCEYTITQYEALHPHKVYVICSTCGKFGGYTASSSYLASCSDCNDTCNCSSSYSGNYKCTANGGLRIRSTHSTSGTIIGFIPQGATVYVSKANGSWAHVTYDGVSGLASMAYLDLIEGDQPTNTLTKDDRYPTPIKMYTLSAEHWGANAYFSYEDLLNAPATDGQYICGDTDGVGDYVTINAVYTNGIVYLNCPWGSGTTQNVYSYGDQFFTEMSAVPKKIIAEKRAYTYIRAGSSSQLGWIDPGDEVILLGTSGNYTQIIYPHSEGGYRCAWVLTSEITRVHTPGPAATCTSPQVCITCDNIIADVIDHTPGPAATCTSNQTCTVCGIILAGTTEHRYTAGDYTDPAHPHKIYNTCSCGALKDSGSTTKVSSCIECYPAPTVSVSGVSLNKTNATIDVGDTLNLTATVSPSNATNKAVTWTSSNPSFASVSNGVVTAKSAGTTTIIATTVDGSKTAACVVTVSAPEEPINPNAAAIVVNDITTRAGETFDVTVDVANNPGMCFLQVTLEYDKSVLTLKGASNGSVLSTFENGVNLQWSADADTSKNGTLVTLTFEVNEDAEAGEYTVNTIFREAYDSDLNDVVFTVAAGTITVADFIYGDANGDGEVNGKDAVLLRKYMVNYNYDTGTSSVAVFPGADANGDGEINGKDAVLLRKYMVNYNYDTGTSSVVLGPQQ